ncbi:MAG: hypothetical protein V3V00_15045, partial [Saprospiraceae bacterium]
LIVLGCSESKNQQKGLSNEEVNLILDEIREDDSAFTQKGIEFDSIVTLAGNRVLNSEKVRVKLKLFYFGNHCRGYFNLPDLDTKNLQFFGKKINNMWALKCVTKLNMEEAGGYILFNYTKKNDITGFWSNGHVNFKQGKIVLAKQELDYNTLTVW